MFLVHFSIIWVALVYCSFTFWYSIPVLSAGTAFSVLPSLLNMCEQCQIPLMRLELRSVHSILSAPSGSCFGYRS